MRTKKAVRLCAVVGTMLASYAGSAAANPWMDGSLYFIKPGVELKVNFRCASDVQAEVMVGGLVLSGESSASDDSGLHPAVTPTYWIKTASNQVLPLPVFPRSVPMLAEGVPSGSLALSIKVPCKAGSGGDPGSFFKLYSDAQAKNQVFAFP